MGFFQNLPLVKRTIIKGALSDLRTTVLKQAAKKIEVSQEEMQDFLNDTGIALTVEIQQGKLYVKEKK